MYNVLIVDDEESIKRSLKTIIEQEIPIFRVAGFADDGQEALALMEQMHPELVITDIRMPVMDGLKLVQEIRRRGLQTETMIVSGYSDFGYAKQAMHYGVSDYILKPIDVDEVTNVLKQIADKLSSEQRGLVESGEWIALCREEAEKIVKHLWVLNETAVWNEMDSIRSNMKNFHFSGIRLKEMYIHFLSMLHAEIAGLSGGRIHLQTFPESQWNGIGDLFDGPIQGLIQRAMDEIRAMRNWSSHRNMGEAIRQIDRNFSNDAYSLKDSADLAGMSPTYFSKSFKEEIGMSYTQYIAKLRMDKAIELLGDPANKVYEVAYAVGYSDYAHFAKVFKKYNGFSPTDYRHQLDISTTHSS